MWGRIKKRIRRTKGRVEMKHRFPCKDYLEDRTCRICDEINSQLIEQQNAREYERYKDVFEKCKDKKKMEDGMS